MDNKIIYYDKLFPNYNNDILNKLKIDYESVSFISSPIYSDKIIKIISDHIKLPNNEIIITDCTAGCGGDTIGFLHKFSKVNSIEKKFDRFNYLINNIKAYNLLNKSNVYFGDFTNIAQYINNHNVLYIDPPWGGKDYKKKRNLQIKLDNNLLIDDYILYFINTCIKKPNIILIKLPTNYDLINFYIKLHKYAKFYLYNLKKMFIIVLELLL